MKSQATIIKAIILTYNKNDFFHFLLQNNFNRGDDNDMIILVAAAPPPPPSEDDHLCPSFYVRGLLQWGCSCCHAFPRGATLVFAIIQNIV